MVSLGYMNMIRNKTVWFQFNVIRNVFNRHKPPNSVQEAENALETSFSGQDPPFI